MLISQECLKLPQGNNEKGSTSHFPAMPLVRLDRVPGWTSLQPSWMDGSAAHPQEGSCWGSRLEPVGWTGKAVRRSGAVRNVQMGKGGMEAPARALGSCSSAGTAALGGTGSKQPGHSATCTPPWTSQFSL